MPFSIIKKIRFNWIYYFISTIIIFSYLLGFILNENSGGGGKSDFEGHVWFVVQSFKESFLYTINNYGKWKEAVWPLHHIIHAFLNPFSYSQNTLKLSHFIYNFAAVVILFFCLREKKKIIKNTNECYIISLPFFLLISPYFRTSAYWATTENTALILLLFSIYFFLRTKKKQTTLNIFLVCLFTSLTLYARQYYFFLNILFLFWLLKKQLYKKFIFSVIFYGFFSIPGIYLIYTWGYIYDINSNPTHYTNYISFQNFYINFFCVTSVFFIYSIPFILFKFKELFTFLRKYIFYFFIFGLIIMLLPYNYPWISGKINLGGGLPIKLSVLFFGNYFFLKIISLLGIIVFFYISNLNINNFIILIFTIIIFCLPKIFFQEYLNPFLYILFIFLIDFKNNSFLYKKKFTITLLLYESFILISAIFYQHFF
jgi:hypothetical protein